jgi:two-component system sensor histidine kinase DegS
LDDFGLVPALEQLFDQFQKSTAVKIKVNIAKNNNRLEGRYETAIYRIIQEAMNNAVRHGRANQIWVDLEEKKSENILIVRDDGVGFELDKVEFGHGTTNMRERAETIGGIFEMSSVLNRGTVIKVIMPK